MFRLEGREVVIFCFRNIVGGGLGFRGAGKVLPSASAPSILRISFSATPAPEAACARAAPARRPGRRREGRCGCRRSEAFAPRRRRPGAGRQCAGAQPAASRGRAGARTGFAAAAGAARRVIDARGHLRLAPRPQRPAAQPAPPAGGAAPPTAPAPAPRRRDTAARARQPQHGVAACYSISPGRPRAKPR